MDETPETISEEIRYAPKAVDDEEWIESFLLRRPTGVVGLVDDGAPYLVTQLYVYDPGENAVFLHGANAGKTRDIVERGDGADACLAVSETGRFIPSERPVDFTVEYASVDVFGPIGLVDDPAEKRRVLGLFMGKFAPHLEAGRDYDPIAEASVGRTSVYRIDVEAWSGKRGEKAPDHPGAYEYDEVRAPER